MKYTRDNILGLRVTHKNNMNQLNNPGVVYTITETGVDFFHGHDVNKPTKASYLMESMAGFLNEGGWILIPGEIINNFEIY
jgi:hypothetical protein